MATVPEILSTAPFFPLLPVITMEKRQAEGVLAQRSLSLVPQKALS